MSGREQESRITERDDEVVGAPNLLKHFDDTRLRPNLPDKRLVVHTVSVEKSSGNESVNFVASLLMT